MSAMARWRHRAPGPLRPMNQALPARRPRVLLKAGCLATATGKGYWALTWWVNTPQKIIQMTAIASAWAPPMPISGRCALHPSVAEEFVTMPN